MNKQKIKPLDEERESRSLLSNAVVILHLVFGTLPLLLVVWAVDRLMSDTLTSTAIWMVGAAMLLFALLRGVFYGTSIWRAHRSAYNALTRLPELIDFGYNGTHYLQHNKYYVVCAFVRMG